jgi:hypothetical protein
VEGFFMDLTEEASERLELGDVVSFMMVTLGILIVENNSEDVFFVPLN